MTTDLKTVIHVGSFFESTSTFEAIEVIGMRWTCNPAYVVVRIKCDSLLTFFRIQSLQSVVVNEDG